MRKAILAIAVLLASAGCSSAHSSEALPARSISVAAASDLRLAFDELATVVRDHDGITATITYGSSGQLAEQIVNGAPFDVFASADASYAAKAVHSRGDGADDGIAFATGRLVMWSKTASAPTEPADLADPRYRSIVIANPEHAPYGRAAREALTTAGVWELVKDRLVYADNVADALRIAQSGNADVGLVALSLVIASATGSYSVVPSSMHKPLAQTVVITAGAATRDSAEVFVARLRGPDGQAILKKYGLG